MHCRKRTLNYTECVPTIKHVKSILAIARLKNAKESLVRIATGIEFQASIHR